MKKITLLFTLLTTSLGFSQAPSGAASTPPSRNAADVISIFSQTTDATTTVYSDITGVDLNPNWGAQSGNVTIESISGDRALKIPTFNYQGIDFDGNRQDVSTFTKVHIDIWTNTQTVGFSLINASTEKKYTITSVAGSWQSLDIDLTEFSNQGLDLSTIRQLKFDGGDQSTEIYVDNIYFWKSPTAAGSDATLSDLKVNGATISGFGSGIENYEYEVPNGGAVPTVTATATDSNATITITPAGAIPGDTTIKVVSQNTTVTKNYKVSFKYEVAPTDAPTSPPSFDANNVISFYSESYTSTGLNGVNWDNGSESTESTFAGNKVLNITGTGGDFIGFDVANTDGFVNATSMTHVHVDFWVPGPYVAGQVLKIKLSNHGNGTSETSAIIKEIALPATDTDKWVSLDLALGTDARERIAQILLIHTNSTGGLAKLYVDNAYMYVAGTASIENNKALGFAMFPNPAKNQLTISAKEAISTADVFNVLGRKVKSFNMNSVKQTLDISDLSSGIYLVKYKSAGKTGTAKFIKQ